MSDQTVWAEALISAVARAFYEDEHAVLIDVLLRDKFLRDDDMGPRLSLPARQLRRALQFLQYEQLVKYELVDDLAQGGSQQTKFWYIDINHAVHVIRLRIHLLRRKLEQAELRARSSSVYLCPGYEKKTCNGRYTETEAQMIVDAGTGLFLCRECYAAHEANPDPPGRETYTLRLVDNTRDLRRAVDHMRRVNAQLSAKTAGADGAGGHQQVLRPGIYDLLQKARTRGSGPLTANLPSENLALDIGSKRLAGTGRTAGIRAKKLVQQGVVVDGNSGVRRFFGSADRTEDGADDLNFLKNAMGQEVAFVVEKGGGARANLLATQAGRRRTKLLDAAASRVGVEVDPVTALVVADRKRRRGSTDRDIDDIDGDGDDEGKGKGKDKKRQRGQKGTRRIVAGCALYFLDDNIGRRGREERVVDTDDGGDDYNGDGDGDEDSDDEDEDMVLDPTDEYLRLPEEERRMIFQTLYPTIVNQQRKVLKRGSDSSDEVEEEGGVEWEEG